MEFCTFWDVNIRMYLCTVEQPMVFSNHAHHNRIYWKLCMCIAAWIRQPDDDDIQQWNVITTSRKRKREMKKPSVYMPTQTAAICAKWIFFHGHYESRANGGTEYSLGFHLINLTILQSYKSVDYSQPSSFFREKFTGHRKISLINLSMSTLINITLRMLLKFDCDHGWSVTFTQTWCMNNTDHDESLFLSFVFLFAFGPWKIHDLNAFIAFKIHKGKNTNPPTKAKQSKTKQPSISMI